MRKALYTGSKIIFVVSLTVIVAGISSFFAQAGKGDPTPTPEGTADFSPPICRYENVNPQVCPTIVCLYQEGCYGIIGEPVSITPTPGAIAQSQPTYVEPTPDGWTRFVRDVLRRLDRPRRKR